MARSGAADQYGRACGVIRDNPLVGRPVEEVEGVRELSIPPRRSLSSTESLMTGLKYCVSGISVVTVQDLPDRQQGSGSG